VFVFIFAGVSAVSAVGWGLVMERIHVRWGTALATVISGFAMAVIAVADSLPMAIAFAVLFGLGTGGWTVAQTLIFADYFGREHLGAIRGFAAAVAGPAGAAGPLLAGWLRDEQGDYVMAFTGFLGAMVIVFFALVFATPPQKPPAQQDGD
jgi:MFS family permease